jgi:hypothetical protein
MGKLKEYLLNNLNENEMDDQFELSAFEYVELVERYKNKETEDEYVPTDEELEKLEQMVKDYYNSKEFREYVENYQPTDEEIDAALAEHNAHEDGFDIDAINESVKLKYTDTDILYVLENYGVDPQKIELIMSELNGVWNTKNGVI